MAGAMRKRLVLIGTFHGKEAHPDQGCTDTECAFRDCAQEPATYQLMLDGSMPRSNAC